MNKLLFQKTNKKYNINKCGYGNINIKIQIKGGYVIFTSNTE